MKRILLILLPIVSLFLFPHLPAQAQERISCENRSLECNSTAFPTCKKLEINEKCISPNCFMSDFSERPYATYCTYPTEGSNLVGPGGICKTNPKETDPKCTSGYTCVPQPKFNPGEGQCLLGSPPGSECQLVKQYDKETKCDEGTTCTPDQTGKFFCQPNNATKGKHFCTYNEGRREFSCPTPLGIINTNPGNFVKSLLSILLSIAGGIALILIIASGYSLMTSQGNPEKVQAARERLTSAVVGLLFIIFSLVILRLITVDILKIPGFG